MMPVGPISYGGLSVARACLCGSLHAPAAHASPLHRYGLSMIGQLRMNNLRTLLEDVLARNVPGSFVGG